MDVIGNNIANVNTIGFKQGRAVFQDMLSQTLNSGKTPSDSRGGINPRQVGTGTYLVAVDNIFSQGTVKTTQRVHDVAIEGNGFFLVRGERDSSYYTRAGDFNFDQAGYLTTPSGMRVQGWMSDPKTGEMQYNTNVSDIFITKDHDIMAAKETTNVRYSGVLGTEATASRFEFARMYTMANARMNIYDALSDQTVNVGLQANDTLRVQAHATGLTDVGNLINKNGQNMTLTPNVSNVTFAVTSGSTYNFLYSATTDGTAGDGHFRTMNGLLEELNTAFEREGMGALASISEGRITITNTNVVAASAAATATTGSFDIASITSHNAYLTNLFSEVTGTYGRGTTKRTGEVFFQRELAATADFNDFEELSNKIQNTINGNVVSEGFAVEFLENEFGLKDGELISASFASTPLDENGQPMEPIIVTATFTYRENPADVYGNEGHFNSLSQLINNFNQVFRANNISASMTANQGGIEFINGGSNFAFSSIRTMDQDNTPSSGSAYLDAVFKPLSNFDYAPTERKLIEEVNGKGRIVYANDNQLENVTGFSILKATSGQVFNNNILTTQGSDINARSAATSKRFLTTADETTNMRDIFSEGGNYCFFIEGQDFIDLKAQIDHQDLATGNSFALAIDSTVEDFMDFTENYLGLGPDFNSKDNVTMADGMITVVGAKGEANDINLFNLSARQTNGDLTFTNAFGQVQQKEEATGGRFVTTMPIYDQQGNRHMVQFDFAMFNESGNEWTMRMNSKDPDTNIYLNGATTNELVVKFNSDGTPSHIYDRHSVPIRVLNNPTFDLEPSNGANTVRNVEIFLGTSGLRDGLTLSNTKTTMNSEFQDGHALGILEDKLFNEEGQIIGYYTNSQTRVIGKLALATFQNNQGLQKVGDTMFIETSNSGMAVIGEPLSGSRGKIASSALEQSNVDLSNEFVDLIITERGFQANSRVITTSDEMIQELLNLKR
jgi:flagellar hook-basal body protein